MKSLRTLLIALPFITISPLVAAHADALDLTVDVGSAKQKGNYFSDSDTSVGLALGFELNSNWSLNLSYTDFGNVFTSLGGLIVDDAYFETRHFMQTKGFGLSAQYLTDPLLGGWSFGGRFGLMHVDWKMTYLAPDYMDGVLAANQDSGTALTGGVLASYSLTEQLNLILSADYMAPEVQHAANFTEDIKTTRFAVGLNYHF